jgi:hypothetical protein
MSDIVARLLAGCSVDVTEAMYEAAQEIKRLRTEVAALKVMARRRGALAELADGDLPTADDVRGILETSHKQDD